MKSKLFVFMCMAVFLMVGTASAGTVQYTYYWTAADLLKNVYVDGEDGSTAADNGLFDGAGLLRDDPYSRTWVESQHSAFSAKWNELAEAGYVYDEYNLWGLDGRGAFYGEDYKPLEWLNVTAPDGWVTGYHQWQWGTPPTGYNTLDFPYFIASAPEYAIAMNNPGSWGNYKFSVTIAFDEDDAFWGQDTKGAPNILDSHLTMWAGGYLTKYDEQGNMGPYIGYDTNFNAAVPEPTTMLLLGAGLLGLAGLGRKKFFNKD